MTKKKQSRADTPTAVEYNLRVCQVYTWILDGYSKQQILKMSADRWGIKKRSVEYLIACAREEIGRVTDEEKASAFGEALKRLNELYMLSKMNGDLKSCLAVQKEINELYHLKEEENKMPNITIVVADDPNDFV